MAGTDPGFDPLAFRNAIHFAMRMGAPNQTIEQVTFRWVRDQSFSPQDPARRPYHWDEPAATDTTMPDVVLQEVAVAYPSSADSTGTEVGTFVPVKAQLTMLDEDYEQVRDAKLVLLGGDVYEIIMTTVEALFSVDVYTIFCERQ